MHGELPCARAGASLFLASAEPSFYGKAEDDCALVDAEVMRMGSMSIWHWILVLAVGLLLFGGRGKISDLMGDFAKGIKSFKKGLAEDEKPDAEPAKADPIKTIDHQTRSVGAPSSAPAETHHTG
jgi:sec-independent protein translocase protein TatA